MSSRRIGEDDDPTLLDSTGTGFSSALRCLTAKVQTATETGDCVLRCDAVTCACMSKREKIRGASASASALIVIFELML